jgi:hypothetical protein
METSFAFQGKPPARTAGSTDGADAYRTKLFTSICEPAAMSLALALVLATSVSPPASLVLHGECIYPPRLAKALPDATQVLCDTVEVSAQGADFAQDQWAAHARFFGTWRGDILTVTAMQPRNERKIEAKGHCRIDHANRRISLISCSAFGGGRGWVANFRNAQ